jgi:hypothetical protein
VRDTSARARERAVTENLSFLFPDAFVPLLGETNKLSLLDSREHKTRATVFPRARARARMHRPARETLRLAVFDSERARVRSSRLLRASEREREPQEREREREGVVARYQSPKSVGNNTRDDCCCCSWCAEEKKGEKKDKRWIWREDFMTTQSEREHFLSMALVPPFFGLRCW